MTKSGGFKRALRRQARATGKTYTEVRAAHDADEAATRVSAATRWRGAELLPSHLERRYGIAVATVTKLSPHGAGVFRVDRRDGPSWVARVFPEAARASDRLQGDVDILRFLEDNDFPAERCAHAEPLSTYEGQRVLVTEHVTGSPTNGTAEHVHAIADALGRLHSLPKGAGGVSRAGGAFGHDPTHEGRPMQDLLRGSPSSIRSPPASRRQAGTTSTLCGRRSAPLTAATTFRKR